MLGWITLTPGSTLLFPHIERLRPEVRRGKRDRPPLASNGGVNGALCCGFFVLEAALKFLDVHYVGYPQLAIDGKNFYRLPANGDFFHAEVEHEAKIKDRLLSAGKTSVVIVAVAAEVFMAR